MKKNILLFCSLLFLASCTPDSNSSSQAAVAGANQTVPKIAHVEASVLAPLIGYWEFGSVVGIKDADIRAAYAGKYIDLKGDQTFTFGEDGDQTNTGKWSYDAETLIINFTFDKPVKIANEFKVQGTGGDVVIFKGNTPNNPRGIQVKMVKNNPPVQ